MDIVLQNVQSIKYARYNLPEKGVVKICGGNSNGKSVLVKTLNAIVSLEIMNESVRRSLINDDAMEAYIVMTRNNMGLAIKLHEDRKQCFVSLTRSNGEDITRTFRDQGIEELLWEFGWRVYCKNSICLQIYETFGPMPFVNTSSEMNGELVEAHVEDPTAKQFLKVFKEITHPLARNTLKDMESKVAHWTAVKQNIVLYDYKAYDELHAHIEEVYHVLSNIDVMELEELQIPPHVTFLDIMAPELSELRIPPKCSFLDIEAPKIHEFKLLTFMPHIPMMEDLSKEIIELADIRNGRCPTCGKLLCEDSHH